jgi:hypothetical protein
VARRRPAADQPEAGTGLIASAAGLLVFLLLMLLAVQVLFDLYARSAVTAAAFDAARRVAGYEIATLPPEQLATAEADAEAQARNVLGRYAAETTFRWDVTATDVALRVMVRNRSVLPAALTRAMNIDTIDRTVQVHSETLICTASTPCHAETSP